MRILLHVDRGDAALYHLDQAGRDVAALAFRLEDHAAAMRRPGIGAKHHKQVRKVRHGEGEIGGRVVIGPGMPEVLAVAAVMLSRAAISETLKPVEITMISAWPQSSV